MDRIDKIRWNSVLIAALFMLFIGLGQLYNAALGEGDMVEVAGVVEYSKYEKVRRSGSLKGQLVISISGNNYVLLDVSDSICYELYKQVRVGDSVTIFHRKFLQSIIGTGSEYRIMVIKQKGIDIYPLSLTRRVYGGLGLFLVIIGLVFGCLYFLRLHKLRRK